MQSILVRIIRRVSEFQKYIVLNNYLYDQTGYIYLELDCSKGPNLNADFNKIEITLLDGEKRVVVDGYGIVPLSEPNEYMMEVQNTTSNFIPSKVEVTLDEQSYFFDLNIFLLSW